MTNELGDEEFVDRLSHFDWVNLYDVNGNLKFEAIVRYEDWQDVIQPDSINIIDYLEPGENPYFIGVLIDKIRQKLDKGIALISIQKKLHKWYDKQGNAHFQLADYGAGGQYSEHRARLVIHLEPTDDYEFTLYIKKSKTYRLTGRRFAFEIVDYGSKFHNIREI